MTARRISSLLATLILAIIALVGSSSQSALTTQSPASLPAPSHSTSEYHLVVRVVDGDTLVVRIGTKQTKVRLIGLDTPEVVDPRKPVQCFGRTASDEAHHMLDGTSVRLETDPSQDTYDKYGRLLAYAFIQSTSTEDVLFNKYMIEQGFGHEYTYRLPYKYQAQFKAAEKSAREAGRGLWAPGVCGN